MTNAFWDDLLMTVTPSKEVPLQASPLHTACASCGGPKAIAAVAASARINVRVFMILSTSRVMLLSVSNRQPRVRDVSRPHRRQHDHGIGITRPDGARPSFRGCRDQPNVVPPGRGGTLRAAVAGEHFRRPALRTLRATRLQVHSSPGRLQRRPLRLSTQGLRCLERPARPAGRPAPGATPATYVPFRLSFEKSKVKSSLFALQSIRNA